MIYELVFSPDHAEDEEIEIAEQRGPQCDLLATCSEIHNEAKPIFGKAVELFQSKLYRYHITIDHDSSWQHVDFLTKLYLLGIPHNLPHARSIAIKLSHVSAKYGLRYFTMHIELNDNGESKSQVRKAWNCNPAAMGALAFWHMMPWFRDLSAAVGIKGGLSVWNCLFAAHAIVQEASRDERGQGHGVLQFWETMDELDDRSPEMARWRREDRL